MASVQARVGETEVAVVEAAGPSLATMSYLQVGEGKGTVEVALVELL
jgi:hypothetical protein